MLNKDLVLGIDIGGTNTAFGLVDRAGVPVNSGTMPTGAGDTPEIFIERLSQAIDRLISTFPFSFRLLGIGIGTQRSSRPGHGRKICKFELGRVR